MRAKRKSARPLDPSLELTRISARAEGEWWYSLDEAARFLGISRNAMIAHVESGHVVTWTDKQGEPRLPRWQFDATGGMVTGIRQVLEIFRSRDEWRVMRYFLGLRVALDNKRPLDLLRAGEVGRVVSHARTHFEDDTW